MTGWIYCVIILYNANWGCGPLFTGIHGEILVWLGVNCTLQALVYDILPSTTAVFSYIIGSWKLSASEQFFIGAQTVLSLLQTTQIKQGVSFIAANKVYTGTNKNTIVWIVETELFFFLFLFSSNFLPNSARFSYATEGVLFIYAQLSSDAVSVLRKVRVLIWL